MEWKINIGQLISIAVTILLATLTTIITANNKLTATEIQIKNNKEQIDVRLARIEEDRRSDNIMLLRMNEKLEKILIELQNKAERPR